MALWDITTWWLVGGVALVLTAFSLLALRDKIVALFVADATGMVLWVLWGIQAFAVERDTYCCGTVVESYPSLGYLALVFAALMILDLFVSVFEAMASQASGSNGE